VTPDYCPFTVDRRSNSEENPEEEKPLAAQRSGTLRNRGASGGSRSVCYFFDIFSGQIGPANNLGPLIPGKINFFLCLRPASSRCINWPILNL
jgi:hypothetical protein